jgi:hypothetical protein
VFITGSRACQDVQIAVTAEEAAAKLSFLYDRKEELSRLRHATDETATEALPDTTAEELQ